MDKEKRFGVCHEWKEKTDFTGDQFLKLLKLLQLTFQRSAPRTNWDKLKSLDNNPNYEKFLQSHISLNTLKANFFKNYDLLFNYWFNKDGLCVKISAYNPDTIITSINKVLDDVTNPNKRDNFYHKYIKAYHNMTLEESIEYLLEKERREIEEERNRL